MHYSAWINTLNHLSFLDLNIEKDYFIAKKKKKKRGERERC